MPASPPRQSPAAVRAAWALLCAAFVGLFVSFTPASVGFWDPGSFRYWRSRYLPDERARQFVHVLPLVPPEARTASTDYVHPRFTHHARSYDYSDYRRRVANYEDRVPDDTDMIILDLQHHYSRVRRAEDVRELQREPDRWERVPHAAEEYFLVLRRRAP